MKEVSGQNNYPGDCINITRTQVSKSGGINVDKRKERAEDS
jgi:hypothetical protein